MPLLQIHAAANMHAAPLLSLIATAGPTLVVGGGVLRVSMCLGMNPVSTSPALRNTVYSSNSTVLEETHTHTQKDHQDGFQVQVPPPDHACMAHADVILALLSTPLSLNPLVSQPLS